MATLEFGPFTVDMRADYWGLAPLQAFYDYWRSGGHVTESTGGVFNAPWAWYYTGLQQLAVWDGVPGGGIGVSIYFRGRWGDIYGQYHYLDSVSAEVGLGSQIFNLYGFKRGSWSFAVPPVDDELLFGGADSIYGAGGDDYLRGHGGDDKIYPGIGADTIDGGAGSDTVTYTPVDVDWPSRPWISQAERVGGVVVRLDLDSATGVDGKNDVLVSIENVIGSPGPDTIYGDDGDNFIDGGDGLDIIYAGAGNDYINDPTVQRVLGGAGNDLIEARTYDERYRAEIAEYIDGGEGNDNVIGLGELRGGPGDDRLASTSTADEGIAYVMRGGAGHDQMIGGMARNIMYGDDGNDQMFGGNAADEIYGGDGNDWVEGGAGADLLDGGLGSDTVTYAGAPAGIVANLDQGWAADGYGARDFLLGVEDVIGSDYPDVIVGTIGIANVLTGNLGDDYLFFDALDTIVGGWGTDRAVVLGESGVDITIYDIEWLWCSNAPDTVTSQWPVTIFGLDGHDTLTGSWGSDQIYGQDGADNLSGGEGDDWLYIDSQDLSSGSVQGGSGSDRAASLDGSALSFDLGASSIEWVWASNLADSLDGSTQTNPLYLFAFDAADTLRGGSGNDNLYGMAGADALYGGAGNDVLYFDSDDTVVDGGADYDTAQVLDYTGVGVTLNLGTSQIEAVYASNQSDTLDASTATWAVYMNGYNGDDVMSGGSGDDNIYGGGGADTISGGGGNDFLDGSGGAEIDILVVSGNQVDYILHYTSGTLTSVQDLMGGRDGWDNVAGFERIQFADSPPGNLFVV